jgi:hypothetical protein
VVRSGFVQTGGYGSIPAMRTALAANGRDVEDDCLRKRLNLHGDLLAVEPGEISRRLPGNEAAARGEDYEVRSVAMTAATSLCAWMEMVDALDGRRTRHLEITDTSSPAPTTATLWTNTGPRG